MNWDRIEGNWKQPKFAGCLQDSYGIAKDEAGKQVSDFQAECERNQWVQ